jgi:hypothetical protein
MDHAGKRSLSVGRLQRRRPESADRKAKGVHRRGRPCGRALQFARQGGEPTAVGAGASIVRRPLDKADKIGEKDRKMMRRLLHRLPS